MGIELNFDNKVFFEKLKVYFEKNIKAMLKIRNKILLITKKDIFYDINIYDVNIPLFILKDDCAIIESMIIKELCNKKIIDLSYGWDHYFARSIDNKIYCWGNNACGQLGKGIRVSENPSIMNINKLTDYDEEQMNEPELNVYLSELNINVIKCGALHSLALTQSGEVYAWGFNEFGQIGNCCNENQLVPTKIDSFDNEQVIMLSCGLMHSMVLTKSGRVFRWGDHKLEYSRIESSEELNKPKQLDLNNLAIVKISCGLFHSLLLDEDGVIYALGYPYSCRDDIGNNGIEQKLKKLDHVKIFLDIASHYCESTSIALSFDNIFYIWGGCKENIFAIQIGTEFKSFNQIFSHYFDYYSEISEELIEFTDSFFQNGFYKKYFNELYSIGKESYGKVYEILSKKSREILSEIKIIRLKREFKNEILREFHNKSLVEEILDQYVIEHISAWLKNSNNDDNIILYVLLESCYEGSGQIMKEMDGLIGCYKGIYLFNDILEYVEYLYKNFKQKNSNTSISEMKDETYNLRFIKSDDYVHLAIYENAEQSKISFFKQNENIAKISQKKQYEFDIYYFGTHLSKILDMDMFNDETKTMLYQKHYSLKALFDKMLFLDQKTNDEIIIDLKNSWSLNKEEIRFIELISKSSEYDQDFYSEQASKLSFSRFDSCSEIVEDLFQPEEFFFLNEFYRRNFEELEILGIGSYGRVYKVRESRDTDCFFAIKVIEFEKLFKNEILKEFHRFNVSTRLTDQFVVNHIFSWFEISKNESINLYMKMELCDRNFKYIINEIHNDLNLKNSKNLTPLGYYIACELFIEILEAVQYLHGMDIIHGDLNPTNIMLKNYENNERFLIKIGDFGISSICEFSEKSHSSNGYHKKYMAPEDNKKKLDNKADIYSLGVILLELFDIEIYKSYDEEKEIPMLMRKKYNGIRKLFDIMTRYLPVERPNCVEILERKHSWTLTKNEFEFEDKLRILLQTENFDDIPYVYLILKSKLKYPSAKQKAVNKSRKNERFVLGKKIKEVLIRKIIEFLAYDVTETFIQEVIQLFVEKLLQTTGRRLFISILTLAFLPLPEMNVYK